jgi:hypothetical protein
MHTVVETSTYLRRAKVLPTEAERDEVVTMIAADPSVGVVIPGTGGFRKVRVALQGGGKSGGARVIYYFCGADTPGVSDADLREEREGERFRRREGRAGEGVGRIQTQVQEMNHGTDV